MPVLKFGFIMMITMTFAHNLVSNLALKYVVKYCFLTIERQTSINHTSQGLAGWQNDVNWDCLNYPLWNSSVLPLVQQLGKSCEGERNASSNDCRGLASRAKELYDTPRIFCSLSSLKVLQLEEFISTFCTSYPFASRGLCLILWRHKIPFAVIVFTLIVLPLSQE